MCDAIAIAKYIINRCAEDNEPVSNLQLQGILYIIQKTFLRAGGVPVFENEFEAWQIGPVILKVYNSYCGFGALRIRLFFPDVQVPDEFRKTIDCIIRTKQKLAPWELAEETLDAAWKQTYSNGTGNHRYIPKSLIRQQCLLLKK